MATSEQVKAALAQKMAGGSAPASSSSGGEQVQDRFIKGTLIDDRIIQWLMVLFAYTCFIALIGAGFLWAERSWGVKQIQVWRIWVPTVYMLFFMIRSKPFKFGAWGYGLIFVQSINLSGYLFQAIQSVTGVR